MGIFGQLDAAAVKSNPYFIAAGDYNAEVTDAKFKKNSKDQNQLVIEYTVTDEDSEFLDSKAYHYFTLPDPDLTAETMALLPAEEQKSIRRTMSSMKRALCGNDGNDKQKGLGVDVEDLNDPGWDPAILVGTKVVIGIANYGANNEGVNVKWVNLSE